LGHAVNGLKPGRAAQEVSSGGAVGSGYRKGLSILICFAVASDFPAAAVPD
jgi:hypothetical protein